jgi:carbamoyl-phosphate synthase small subunit
MRAACADVVGTELERYAGAGPELLVVDTGAKESIIRSLQSRGASLIRAPFFARWEPLLNDVDGVVLTNGPGDPTDLAALVARIRASVLSANIPTFGICLGHQLLALAAGGKTCKLKYGHRSQNQPVVDLTSDRAYVTSQNHGYAVADGLPEDWEPWFRNLNDGTNEGLRHKHGPFRSVQFHPEAAAGPHDTAFLFDDFLRIVGEMRKAKRDAGQRKPVTNIAT